MEETGGNIMVSNLAKKLDSFTEESKVVFKEKPLKWCTVTLSEVIGRGKRLEATVFDVDGRNARELIANNKYNLSMLGGENGLTTSYTGARFKRIWLKKSKFPIFQPSSITDVKPSPDGYISEITQTNIDKLRVKKGQILLTCSGTIGKASIVSKTLDNCIFSHDLLRIDCKKKIDIGFVYAYLKSEIGNKILLTNSYGSVITHIEPEHLAEIPIPNPPEVIKEKIHNLIMKSFELRDESNNLIDEATKLLIDELHLPNIEDFELDVLDKSKESQSFNVKLSDMNGRLDASYHVPIIDSIKKHLQQYAEKVTTVGDVRISKNVILPGRFKRVYVEEGMGKTFIGGKQLYELDPSNKKYLSLVHHGDRITKQLELKENMTLITCSGTIGKVILVPKHWDSWTANQHIIRVIPASNDIAGYLSIFLSSDFGYQLITRFTYGSVVDEIDDNHVRQIPMPLLRNKTVQKQINDLALEANEKRYQAYKLEQQALRIMDEEVIYAR